MEFHLTLLNKDGTISKKTVIFQDRADINLYAEMHGVTVISAKKKFRLQLRKTRKFDIVIFCQQLVSLLDAGQTIYDAIHVLHQHNQASDQFEVYQLILKNLSEGKLFSESLGKREDVFPSLFISLVKASETTGNIGFAVSQYLQYREKSDFIRDKIKSAIWYPAILLVVGSLVICFLMFYVIPKFSTIFDDALPGSGQANYLLIAWGHFFLEWKYFVYSASLILFLCITVLVQKGYLGQFFIKAIRSLNVVKRYLDFIELSKFYRTLSLLLRSGVSLVQAIDIAKSVISNSKLDHVHNLLRQVKDGEKFSLALQENNLSTPIAEQLVVAGEKNGNLEVMLEKTADFFDLEINRWVEFLSRIIEPVLMIGLGLIVGVIVLMLYSPIFDLASSY